MLRVLAQRPHLTGKIKKKYLSRTLSGAPTVDADG